MTFFLLTFTVGGVHAVFGIIKNNQQFRFVYKNGRSYANKYFIMYVKENGLDKNRIGISVSKKSVIVS